MMASPTEDPMRQWKLGAAAIAAVAVAAVLVSDQPLRGQQPACLHSGNEAPDQAARRRMALVVAREINSLEAVARGQSQVYQPLEQLTRTVDVPAGFVAHLATDGRRYAFSVKDTLDACHFGYFSDQDGVIFEGQAIR